MSAFPSSVRALVPALAGMVAIALATPSLAAAKRMVTYDSASPEAQRLTGAGLTFVFTRSFLRQRILAVRATAVPVGVVPEPLRDSQIAARLDDLMGEDRGTGALYEIAADKAEGKIMVQAFCPGATRGWLAIGAIAHQRDLRVHAFGEDAAGQMRLCSVMDFTWRGEWRMPNPNAADVTARVMRPDYIKTPGS